ncbi:NAD(P)-dependent oxidoreductase, partial [Longimicrobium sp.]|uniref:NAD-dependent epimerase/dehydratase family protein n=1 Tax=Longimicrobium sp. TaxID=2029185 RepID=UPI002E333337
GAARVVDAVRPDALLHLAWYTEHGRFWTSLENYRWVGASLELFRAFAGAGGARIVATGTCAEYDWSAGTCDERDTPLRPATPYGACKLATGQLLASLAERTGMRAAWARLFFLYGPHEHPDRLVPSVARALLAGEPARCTHGAQLRDFLHVRDVASACVALLESGVTGPVNVAAGRAVALRTVVEGVARHAGDPGLVRLGALPAPADDPPVLAASAARLRDEVGWTPALDLDAGLADAVAWWRGRRISNG